MTISAQGVRAVYDGSDSVGPFTLQDADAEAILFVANSEILVTHYDTDGDPTVLVDLIDYTLTGAGSSTAGSLTLTAPLAVGEQLVILRRTARTQLIDLMAGGTLSRELLEGFFDKLIRIDQEADERLARAVSMPINTSDDTFVFPVPLANGYIGWNADGDDLENKERPSAFYSGATVPDPLFGVSGDYYLRTTNGDLYLKTGGSWAVTASLIGPTGDTGDPGPAGTSVLSGAGVPSNGLGSNGDFYINTSDYTIYGPKASGVWGSGTSLVGPSGAGTGDVVGPASSVTGRLASFNGTTGKLIADSGVLASAVLTTSTGQPLDADLTAIAALTTTSFGRSVLETANAAALATLAGVGTGNSPQFTAIELGNASDTTIARSAAGQITVEGVPVVMAGKHSIPISAASMSARATSGAAAGTFGVGIPTFDFDQTTQEYVIFSMAMPKSWNEGTVTFTPYWTATSGTGTVRWALQAVGLSNDDAGAAPTFGTAQNSDDTLITASDIHTGPESSSITVGGSPAEGDMVIFQLSRDPANDTLTADAKLLHILLHITTNAGTDA